MIKIEKKVGIYYSEVEKIAVRQRFEKVLLLIDEAVIEFTIVAAMKLGHAIAIKSGELLPGEYVSVTINGKEIQLLKSQGVKVGGTLMRKADIADDYQIKMRA